MTATIPGLPRAGARHKEVCTRESLVVMIIGVMASARNSSEFAFFGTLKAGGSRASTGLWIGLMCVDCLVLFFVLMIVMSICDIAVYFPVFGWPQSSHLVILNILLSFDTRQLFFF